MRVTTYVTDIRYRNDVRTVPDAFFGPCDPASNLLEVGSLSHPET